MTAAEPLVPPRRARRFFALPSGVVLAVAIGMPLVKVCGTVHYPIAWPMFWGPYLLGGVVIAMALCRTARGLRQLVATAQFLVAAQCGPMGVATITSGYGVLLIAAAVGFVLLTRRGDPERRATRVLIAGGAMCLAWFAPFMGDPEGLWGAYVSTGAAMAVMLSGLEWRRELGKDRIDPMPTARVRD